MMAFGSFRQAPQGAIKESLRIDRNGWQASGKIGVLQFRDKETGQFVVYLPSLDISGYGDTIDKARMLIEFSVEELISSLLSMQEKEMQLQLRKLGWENTYPDKEFSHAYIDADGALKELNAGDPVERLVLESN